ncbi:MAG: hypothetical protein HRF46_04485 [Acidobacteriota bacterium]|jgi:hypothetical protein
MVKIDRLGWAAGFSIDAYGVTIGVRATDGRVLERLRQAVPFGARPSRRRRVDYLYSVVVGSLDAGARPRRFHLVYSDLRKLVRTLDLEQVVEALEQDMTLEMGARTRRWVFVHAGVVAWRGRALLLPGRSFAGKSTLVEALVRAGAVYYSDEYAVLDLEGRVHPYPRPLSRRAAGEFKGRPVALAALGGEAGDRPLEVTAVVFTHFREGARPRWRALSPGQGLLGLVENAVAARTRTELVMPVLMKVAQGAALFKGVRGEAAEVVPRLLRLLE